MVQSLHFPSKQARRSSRSQTHLRQVGDASARAGVRVRVRSVRRLPGTGPAPGSTTAATGDDGALLASTLLAISMSSPGTCRRGG